MSFTLKIHLNYDSIYRSACSYAFTLHQQYAALDLTYNPVCLRWPQVREFAKSFFSCTYISALYKQYAVVDTIYNPACLRWPHITDFAQRHFIAGKTFLWTYKGWVAGSVMLGVALGVAYCIWKNRPQFPRAKLESSMNVAVIDVEVVHKKHSPPNAKLIFCIDTSGSMNSDERIGAVRKALNAIVDHARKVVSASKEAKISFEIIAFETAARQIADLTSITSQGSEVEALHQKINVMVGDGGTSILSGLEMASQEEKISRANGEAAPTIVLLTDGDDNINPEHLSTIHLRLGKAQAKLFAIGIGDGHKKETLETIVTSKDGSFAGEYKDAKAGKKAIEKAITEIYGRAIDSFTQLELTAPGLKAGTWSVANTTSSEENGRVKFELGSLTEGEVLSKAIDIHWDKLPGPLDLANVKFCLTFIDPNGKKGQFYLPFNPNTTIHPRLIKRAKSLGSNRV
jgi:Mg-chelatase subunit ChlD